MQNNTQTQSPFRQRQIQKIFQEIDDEIAILTATAKFNHATCKTDTNGLKLTLAYIEDTTKLVSVLKSRINLLVETIG
ncbi:MAG: hypothetical protein ACQCN4_09610 [Candidatus Bathyarchaeia archaeon]|jgi:hypothetical protein